MTNFHMIFPVDNLLLYLIIKMVSFKINITSILTSFTQNVVVNKIDAIKY